MPKSLLGKDVYEGATIAQLATQDLTSRGNSKDNTLL